ncbi:MarR family winged helix-turn-helix transcriptional regulator [Pleomorphochaeta sp. DL1XJH-081]|jgi:DNA-binding MarR family transcriptional regulator|uniref:MarR family winged helix-turn-helix transcriptional regulator n=1 Tax=Pleomorphochaeta sp. DL1XJH-081 TaxID=3409690 RepID=UPI003BB7C93D
MEFHHPDPIRCESIPLLAQITRLRFVRAHALFGSLGIHPSQFHLLSLLAKAEGLNQTEIANHLFVKASTLTVMLGRLEKATLVTRYKDPLDARVFRVRITELGRSLLEEAAERFYQIEQETFANFTDEERMQFEELAKKIRDNLVTATQGDENPCPWC